MSSYLVLEPSEFGLKVLVAQKKRRKPLAIEHAFAVDCSDLPKDAEGAIQRGVRLKEALRQQRISVNEAAILLPKQSAIVRLAQLPSADEDEIAGMAQFEVEKFIPFHAERHIVSHSILHSDGIEGSSVLLAAVDAPVIEEALAILEPANVDAYVGEVTTIAFQRTFQAFHADPPESDRCEVLLYLTRSQTEIVILHEGMPVTARSQAIGMDKLCRDLQQAMHLDEAITLEKLAGLDLLTPDDFLLDGGIASQTSEDGPTTTAVGEKARAWIARVVRFIRQTFEHAAREHQIPMDAHIYLAGEGTALRGLQRALSINLKTDVRLFDPMGDVPRAGKGRIDEAILPGMVCALGTAMRLAEEEENPRARANRINLLPREVLEQQEAAERKMLLMVSATMVVITLCLLFLAWQAQQDHNAELRERYTVANEDMEELVEELEEKSFQLDIIRRITENRTPALYILDQIATFEGMGSQRVGGVLTLTDFNYSSRDEVNISGTAITPEDFGRFADFLERMQYQERFVFASVSTPQPDPQNLSRRGQVWAFKITAELNDLSGGDDDE